MCDEFLKRFNAVLASSGYKPFAYGKAQKIINVTFKYLYLFDDAEMYEKYFCDCHFILSSENLDWYKKHVEPRWAKIAWSSLDFDEYIRIQGEIRKFLRKHLYYPSMPFIAEFYIWSSSFD